MKSNTENEVPPQANHAIRKEILLSLFSADFDLIKSFFPIFFDYELPVEGNHRPV